MDHFDREQEHHTTDEYRSIPCIRQPLVLSLPTRVDLLRVVLRALPDSADGISVASSHKQQWSTSSDRSPTRSSAPYSKAGPMLPSMQSSSPSLGSSAGYKFPSPSPEHFTSGEEHSTFSPRFLELSPQRFFSTPREFPQDYFQPSYTSSRPSSFSMPRFVPDLQMGTRLTQNSSEFSIPSMNSVKSSAAEQTLPQSLSHERNCSTLDASMPRIVEENIQPKIAVDLDKVGASIRGLEAKLGYGITMREFDEIKHLSFAHQQVHLQHSSQAAVNYNPSSSTATSFTSGSNLPTTAKPAPTSDPVPIQATAHASGKLPRPIILNHHPSSASSRTLSSRNPKTLVQHKKQTPQNPPANQQAPAPWRDGDDTLENTIVIQHPHNYDVYVRGLPENTDMADLAEEMTPPEPVKHEAGVANVMTPGRRNEHARSPRLRRERRSASGTLAAGIMQSIWERAGGVVSETGNDRAAEAPLEKRSRGLRCLCCSETTVDRSSTRNNGKSADVPMASLRGGEASGRMQCSQEPSTPATTIEMPTTTLRRSPRKHKACVEDFQFSTLPKSSGVGTMTRSKAKIARGGMIITERSISTSTLSSLSTLSSMSELQDVSEEEDDDVSTASLNKPEPFVEGTKDTVRSVSCATNSSSSLSSLSQFQDDSEWDGDDMFEPSRTKSKAVVGSTVNSTSTPSTLSEFRNLSDEEDGDFSEPNRTSMRRPVSPRKNTPVLSKKRKAEDDDLNSSPTKRVKPVVPPAPRRRNPPRPRKLALFKGTRTIVEDKLKQEGLNITAEKEKVKAQLSWEAHLNPAQHVEDEYYGFAVPSWQRGSLTNIFQAGTTLPQLYGSFGATTFAADTGLSQIIDPRLIDPRLIASSFRDTVSSEDLIHERFRRSSEDDGVEDAAQTLTDMRKDSAVAFHHQEMIKAEGPGSGYVRKDSGVDVDDNMDVRGQKDVVENEEWGNWRLIDSRRPWLGHYRALRGWEIEEIDEPMDGDVYD